MTPIESVRLKTSDQPQLRREASEGNGQTLSFRLSIQTILASPVPKVWINSVAKTILTDFTVDYVNGIITLATIPSIGDKLLFEVLAVIYTDEEIDEFLSAAGGNTTYAAALNLFAWAANAAKLAKKETLSGGGPVGAVTLDLAVTAEQLRKSANAYLDLYKALAIDDNFGPADGITEVAWTEHSYNDIYEQGLFRESD